MPLPELFSSLPAPFADAFQPEAPWELLGSPLDDVLAGLPSERIEIGLSPDFHLSGDRIVIGAGTSIHPTVVIEGPVYIGAGVTIRAGAYLRGGCWIEEGAVIGANTEVKHSILLAGAKAPHLAYAGDSVLGAGANLGAGTILSNFRQDGREVKVCDGNTTLSTARRKLGAVLGDGVQTGCNCVLHPGCVVGARTSIYPGVMLRSEVYPADHIVKLEQQTATVVRR